MYLLKKKKKDFPQFLFTEFRGLPEIVRQNPVPVCVHSMFSGLPSPGCSQPLAGFTQPLSWYHSAGMVEKRTWLLWWWQAAATHYTLPPLLPISTPVASLLDNRGRFCSLTRLNTIFTWDFFQTITIWDASSLENSTARSVQAAKLFLKGQHGKTASLLLLPPPPPLLLHRTVWVYMTVRCPLTFALLFSPTELLGAWQRLYPGVCWDWLYPFWPAVICVFGRGLFGNTTEEETLTHDCEAPAPLNHPGSSFIFFSLPRHWTLSGKDGEVKDGKWRGRRRL